MTLRIHRKFIAVIASLAIVITGFSAAPARAGNDELGTALAVILGLAVVGTVINKRNDQKKARRQEYQQQPKPRVRPRHVQRQQEYIQPRPRPRHVNRNVNRKLLPQKCLNNVRTENGRRIQAFGQRCLERNYQFSNSLPQRCSRRVWTRNGAGFAYGARCLNKNGYQLARR